MQETLIKHWKENTIQLYHPIATFEDVATGAGRNILYKIGCKSGLFSNRIRPNRIDSLVPVGWDWVIQG